ncbi:exosortase A [Desulforhabdus sp. TSK]|uniref:exosortase A n=1 Tax=Desulforhabdus sp. TSK TaxID=2925014 RepID=UPI001FC883E8|nr:exosortase A [Desulforhabdus sp. TSK]GKT07868.1 exosortase [Desulforhabdus sp. TSK]
MESKVENGKLLQVEQEKDHGIDWSLFVVVLILTALGVCLYFRVVAEMVEDWSNDPNYSHGFLVPLFSAYLVWEQRSRLKSMNFHGSWLGLPVLLLGIGMLILGEIGAEYLTTRTSLIVMLSGLVLFNLGVQAFKLWSFPLFFLVFMIPLPVILFNAITFPLQNLAAQNAAWALDLLGVPVLLDGNVLHLSHYSLGVTEACSGIRSLVSLLMIAVVWGYFAFKSIGPRLLLAIAAVPITIAANSVRVIVTGLIVQYLGLQYAEGFYHTLLGWLIFLVAFIGLACVHALIALGQRFRQREAG